MEFFINDPNIERRSPPAETRLIDLHAEPDADGKRLRVTLELTPFQQKPDIELSLTNSTGKEISSASIIEPMGWKLELTLHIRKTEENTGKYTLLAILSYPEIGIVEQRSSIISFPILSQ